MSLVNFKWGLWREIFHFWGEYQKRLLSGLRRHLLLDNEVYTVCLDGVNTTIDDNLRYINDKGLIERDHIHKKDTYYLYKAWWNPDSKFVHICGKDYTLVANRVIKCYTNDGN